MGVLTCTKQGICPSSCPSSPPGYRYHLMGPKYPIVSGNNLKGVVYSCVLVVVCTCIVCVRAAQFGARLFLARCPCSNC